MTAIYKTFRPKKCKCCGNGFTPVKALQQTCLTAECAYGLVKLNKAKKKAKEYREAKKRLKSRADWIKEAQVAFNRFIRARDANEPCISCGRAVVEWTTGGSWDCGHFLGVGAAPELRFEESNAHKQCKSCNGGAGKYARKNHTVSQEYRVRLIQKIGVGMVEWLEGQHAAKKYTIEELENIKREYCRLARDLEKQA